MEKRLDGRIALVTGSARGIGEAIARRLCQEGARVWIADIDEPEAKAVARSLENASHARVDITDMESITALADRIRKDDARLDILVNNAAILDTTPYTDLSIERFMEVQDVNLTGALRVTMAMVPLIRGSQAPRILNIASVNGLRGTRDSLAYSTAKGGIAALTLVQAVELARYGVTEIGRASCRERVSIRV